MNSLFLREKHKFVQNASSEDVGEVTGLFGDILSRGISLRVRVTGRSMRPFLRGGETLVIRRVDAASLRRGDLILFRNGSGEPVMHRIVRRRGAFGSVVFQTKGDAALSLDEPVREDEVLGKVCRIERTNSCIDMEASVMRYVNYICAIVNLMKYWIRYAPARLSSRLKALL